MSHPLIIIVGPTGCGKTVMIRKLLHDFPSIKTAVTYTTRPQRKGEAAAEDKVMRFVTPHEFRQRIRQKKFLEWARVYGNYYGTDRGTVEHLLSCCPVILNLDIQGTRAVKKKIPRAHTVFILPTPRTAYLRRVTETRKKEANLGERIRAIRVLLNETDTFDHVIKNAEGRLSTTYRDLKRLVRSIITIGN